MMPGLWTRTAILAGGMSPPSGCLHLLALLILPRLSPGVHCWICNRQRPDQGRTWWVKKIRPLATPYALSFSVVVARATAATQCCEALSKP
ncbi:hypothetical protein BO82DRAFT_171711 [Aspergillus uvarum CBS 121591]|uniref:Secreted protein n=1 Tax=Aspergillus uvarum CBS 121591 TaxID=1448315 RepID=A0A319C0I5_9EURO|nr:hypothetical protein BO82DRAFT_171711 [Aspergillus uvarum CBS 121591]PYH77777.1 hypothetical protein BO82DRAFT_171711 [Aspergillus uvarum CBS 121591]